MADDTQTLDMVHEDQLPGHESELEPKPDWEPRYPGSGRLKGKVALITGGDSGIGRAVAALYAREGADIAIIYLCEHDDAAKTREIVEKEGRRAIAIAGDIGSIFSSTTPASSTRTRTSPTSTKISFAARSRPTSSACSS